MDQVESIRLKQIFDIDDLTVISYNYQVIFFEVPIYSNLGNHDIWDWLCWIFFQIKKISLADA